MAPARGSVPVGSNVRFRAPMPRPENVRRPRVTATIDAALARYSCCIVSAPSGYGKTTAVAEWGANADRLAWLTLNALDADPRRLARGVLDALAVATDGRGGAPSHTSRFDPRRAYAAIIDSLESAEGVVQLVVDDAHRAGEAWREGLLGMLLEQMPEKLRIVLVGTTLLEVTSARERLTAPDLFLCADALRFTADEIAELHAAGSHTLTPVAILEETQGWPIAVSMVMIAGARPDSDATSASAFLADYVRDYVLASLPPALARFMLDASVCAVLDADLAAKVTGEEHAARLLEECARLGLFLDRFAVPEGTRYRWHATFAKTCSSLLAAEDPARLVELHRRAAAHLSRSEPITAISHSLRATDLGAARSTLLGCWLGLSMNGNAAEVETAATRIMMHLPEDAEMLLIRACATDMLGDHHLAHDLFVRGQAQIATSGTADDDVVLDIARLVISDEPERVSAAHERVRERMLAGAAAPALADQVAVNTLLAWAEIRHPTNPVLPAEHFAAVAREIRGQEPDLWSRALGGVAFGHVWAGHLRRARLALDEINATSDSIGASSASGGLDVSSIMAEGLVAHLAGDPTTTSRLFVALTAGDADPSVASVARLMLACAAAEGGDVAACRRAAIGAQEIPVETLHGVPWGVIRETAIAVLEEAIGNRDRALRIARRHVRRTDLPLVALALSGVLRRAEEYSEALIQLRSLRTFAEVSYIKVSTLITAAVMRRHHGDHEAAHDVCEAALAVAASEGIRLPFGVRETAVRRLLGEHVHHGTQFEDFIGECLADDAAGSVAGVLSDREREVYRQLQTSRTLPEIARELGVSVNTIKTHQRSIYRKLDVSSRRDAVRVGL